MWEPEAHTEEAVNKMMVIIQMLGLDVEDGGGSTVFDALVSLGWNWAIETIRGLLHRKDLPDDLE